MRKMWRVLITATVLAALVTGCGGNSSGGDEQAAATETAEAQADDQSEDTVEAVGQVDALTIKQFYLDFPATITDIYVNVGQEVKQGDKLITLNCDDYKASIEEKKIDLELDKIDSQSSKSETGSNAQIKSIQEKMSNLSQSLANGTDSEISDLQSQISPLKSQISKKQKDLELQEQLLEQGAGTQDDVDTLKSDIKDLEDKINTINESIKIKKRDKNVELSDYKSQIATLQDTMKDNRQANSKAASSYSVKQQKTNLEVSRMTNKFTKGYIQGNNIICDVPKGVVKTITAVKGNKVGEDGASLLEVIDEGSLVVKANVPEEFIKDVKIGADVDIIPYADKDAVYKGKVQEIQQMAVNQDNEVVIPVIIKVTQQSPYFNYGYSVDVEIHK